MKILTFKSPEFKEKFSCNKFLLSESNPIPLEYVLKEATDKYNYPFNIQYLGTSNFIVNEVIKSKQ